MKDNTPLSLIKISSVIQRYTYYVFFIFMLSIFSCDEVENWKLYPIGNGHTMMDIDDDDFKADSTKQLFLEGFRYYTQEKFVRARLLYLQAYKQDSTNSILLNALANLECQIDNYEKSDFYFGNAVSMNPEDVNTYINYGKCLMNQKKYSEAIEVMYPRYKTFFDVQLSESAQLKFFSLSNTGSVNKFFLHWWSAI